MAFVRQQLLLPDEPVAAAAVAAADSEAEAQPNVVLLTQKQRQLLIEKRSGFNHQQQQEEVGHVERTARGSGEIVSLDLQQLQQQHQEQMSSRTPRMLSSRGAGFPIATATFMSLRQQQQQQQHLSPRSPRLLSARSIGLPTEAASTAVAIAAAVANLPSPPDFPSINGEAGLLPVLQWESQQQQQLQESCKSEEEAVDSTLQTVRIPPSPSTPKLQPSTPRIVATAAASAAVGAAEAREKASKRLAAVTECAERVREAIELESKISAMLVKADPNKGSSRMRSNSSSSRSSSISSISAAYTKEHESSLPEAGAGGEKVSASVKRLQQQQQRRWSFSAGTPNETLDGALSPPREAGGSTMTVKGSLAALKRQVQSEAAAPAVGEVAATASDPQGKRVVARLSLGSITALSRKPASAGVYSARDEPRSLYHEEEKQTQQQWQQQDYVPLTPKGSTFRIAMAKVSGSSTERPSDSCSGAAAAEAEAAAEAAARRLLDLQKTRTLTQTMKNDTLTLKVTASLSRLGSSNVSSSSLDDTQQAGWGFLAGRSSRVVKAPGEESEIDEASEELEASLKPWSFAF